MVPSLCDIMFFVDNHPVSVTTACVDIVQRAIQPAIESGKLIRGAIGRTPFGQGPYSIAIIGDHMHTAGAHCCFAGAYKPFNESNTIVWVYDVPSPSLTRTPGLWFAAHPASGWSTAALCYHLGWSNTNGPWCSGFRYVQPSFAVATIPAEELKAKTPKASKKDPHNVEGLAGVNARWDKMLREVFRHN